MARRPEMPESVAAVFQSYAPKPRRRLKRLRALIYETASSLDGVGPIEETLKWGQPAYATTASKSGSAIRLGWKEARPDVYFLFFNCQTTLVESFRALFPRELVFEGNRAVAFPVDEPLPEKIVAQCIELALTYRRKPHRR